MPAAPPPFLPSAAWPEIFVSTTPLTLNRAWVAAMGDLIHHAATQHDRGIVVLSSYRRIVEALRDTLPQHLSRPIVTDLDRLPSDAITQYLSGPSESIFLSLSSWTGVRFPPTHLHDLILANLPGPANLLHIEPLRRSTLDDSIAKFRQGLGRGSQPHGAASRIYITDRQILHPIAKHWYLQTSFCPDQN